MKNTIFFLITSLFSLFAAAQGLPEKLGTTVNSDFDEINPVVSPGGDTLYFTRIGHPENHFKTGNNQEVWRSVKNTDGNWEEAQRLSNEVNIGRYNAFFSISPDGQKALISGTYNKKGNFLKKRGLSIITRTKDGWGNPETLKIKRLHKMLDGRYFSATINWEEEVIIMSFSRTFNSKRSKLFVSKKKGKKYQKPSPIRDLNFSGNEVAPFISNDGTTLYFTSNRLKQNGYDIFKTVRQDDTWKKWSKPEAVSERINSKADELYYKEVKDGGVAFFSSDAGEEGNKNIYQVKFLPTPESGLNENLGKIFKRSLEELNELVLADSIKFKKEMELIKPKIRTLEGRYDFSYDEISSWLSRKFLEGIEGTEKSLFHSYFPDLDPEIYASNEAFINYYSNPVPKKEELSPVYLDNDEILEQPFNPNFEIYKQLQLKLKEIEYKYAVIIGIGVYNDTYQEETPDFMDTEEFQFHEIISWLNEYNNDELVTILKPAIFQKIFKTGLSGALVKMVREY